MTDWWSASQGVSTRSGHILPSFTSVTASNEMEALAVLAFKYHIFYGPEEYLIFTPVFKLKTGSLETGSFDSVKFYHKSRLAHDHEGS
jgi:hypothetical protein